MKNWKKILIYSLKLPLRVLSKLELLLIDLYKKTLSLDHGYLGKVYPNLRVCKFTPTCSEYGYGVVKRFGIFKGNYLLIRRVVRCNPWSKPGQYDPIPEK